MAGPTKDMVERSRSGAYIPIGKMQRSQLEATSPWSFAEKAKRLHAEDVCPDCAAEQGMKKLESVKAREEILQAASHFHGCPPPASSPKSLPVDILQAASHFHGCPQPVPSPKPLPLTVSGPKPVAVLDAIKDTGPIVVVQHEGILDRIAMDPRRGPLTRASTQRLSENLAKVSEAVAQLGSVDEHPLHQIEEDTSHMQTDKPEPQPQRPLKIKSCSMSELLDDLHAIAAGMNLDISDPTKKETVVQAPSNIIPVHPIQNNIDPTTSGPAPLNPSHVIDSQNEPHYTRGLTPRQSLLHGEDPESLLSEPTSPGPMSDTALAEAIASHERSQTSNNTIRSPPSQYVTALPTRNNSIAGPIPLPSSILRAADYSPIPTDPVAQRPSGRALASPLLRSVSRFAPGHYSSSPALQSPRSVQSPKPIKRVRLVDRWPPEHETAKSPGLATPEPDQAYIATELQRAVQEVAARERDLHKAVKEAAEMGRSLRRRVRTHGGLSGAFKEQK